METPFGNFAGAEIKTAATDEIKNLIADVEELVARVADLKDHDVAKMRTRVMDALEAAKDSLAGGAETLKRHTQKAVSGADEMVRDNPWTAVGVAALVGAVIGMLVARRD